MLPYEILALLLERKETFILNEFLNLWNYDIVDMKESKNKDDYWKIVTPFLCELLDIDEKTYGKTIEGYRKQILCAKKMYKKLNKDENFSKPYSTWIIAYCLDTNSFFATNQRHFFWEYDNEFSCENDAISYFKTHLDEFKTIRNEILNSTGGWKISSDLYLENTRERFKI